MRAIASRIKKLEVRLRPQPNLNSYRLACILYERRRRRLEAAGVLFTLEPPVPDTSGARKLSACETLQRRREQRRARGEFDHR